MQRKCALGVQRDNYDPRTASWTLLTAGSALYERLFTMQAFARSIGSLYAVLMSHDVSPATPVQSPVQEARDDRQR